MCLKCQGYSWKKAADHIDPQADHGGDPRSDMANGHWWRDPHTLKLLQSRYKGQWLLKNPEISGLEEDIMNV